MKNLWTRTKSFFNATYIDAFDIYTEVKEYSSSFLNYLESFFYKQFPSALTPEQELENKKIEIYQAQVAKHKHVYLKKVFAVQVNWLAILVLVDEMLRLLAWEAGTEDFFPCQITNANLKFSVLLSMCSNRAQYVKTSQSYLTVSKSINKIYESEPRKQVTLGLYQALQFNLFIEKIQQCERTKAALRASTIDNSRLLLSSFLLDDAFNFLARHANIENDLVSYVAWCGIKIYQLRLFATLAVDGIFYVLALTQSATKERKNPELFARMYPGCKEGGGLGTEFKSLINYIGTPYYISFFLEKIFGKLALPFEVLYFGFSFYEYNTGAYCNAHRDELLLKKNMFYLFGYALPFIVLRNMCAALFPAAPHAVFDFSAFLKKNAIHNILFNYFVLAAIFNDKPLPGKVQCINVLEDARSIMDIWTNRAANIFSYLLQPKTGSADAIRTFQSLRQSKLLALLFKVLLAQDHHGLESLMKTKAMELFLNNNNKTIEDWLLRIVELRRRPFLRRWGYLVKYLPNFMLSETWKKIICKVLEEKFDGILENVHNFVVTSQIKIKIYNPELIQKIAEKNSTVIVTDYFPNQVEISPFELINSFINIDHISISAPHDIIDIDADELSENALADKFTENSLFYNTVQTHEEIAQELVVTFGNYADQNTQALKNDKKYRAEYSEWVDVRSKMGHKLEADVPQNLAQQSLLAYRGIPTKQTPHNKSSATNIMRRFFG